MLNVERIFFINMAKPSLFQTGLNGVPFGHTPKTLNKAAKDSGQAETRQNLQILGGN